VAAGEAVKFLADRTGLADDEGAAAVAAELGYLRSALALAAAVIGARKLEYPAYLQCLQATQTEEGMAQEGRGGPSPFPPGAVKAALMSLDEARTADETRVGIQTIGVMAMLSPAGGVRRELLHAAGYAGGLSSGRYWITAAAVDDALTRLIGRSLLTSAPGGQTIVMHPLVATTARSRLAANGWLAAVGQAAAAALEAWAQTFGVTGEHAAIRDFAEHVAALPRHAAGPGGRVGRGLASSLLQLRFLALYHLIEVADHAQAIAVGEPLTADLERVLGPDHPDTMNARNSLAAAYLAAGRHSDAVLLFERTLAGRERVLGLHHLDTLISRNNLAAAYQDAGRVAESISLLQLTLAVRERLLGSGHPVTLNSRGNLAAAYRAAGRSDEAIPLLEQTLAGRIRVLGASHPDTRATWIRLDQARRNADAPAGPAAVESPPAEQPQPVIQSPYVDPEPELPALAAEETVQEAVTATELSLEAEVAAEEGTEVRSPAAVEAARGETEAEVSAAMETVPVALAAGEPEALREPEAAEEPETGTSPVPVPVPDRPAAIEPAEPSAIEPAEPSAAELYIPRLRPSAGPGRSAAGPRARKPVRLPWVAAAFLALLAASGTVGALSHGNAGVPVKTVRSKPVNAAQLAADWVSRQVSHSVTVACDPLMCAALEARGVPTARLLVLRSGAASPRGAGVVVATPAVRSQFGSRLDSEYAPSVIAGFGSGLGQVNVQVVAPDGAAAYRAALRRDLMDRKKAGTQLLGNRQIGVMAQARAELAAGEVDSRLLILLAALAATHPIQVLTFGEAAPRAGPDSPMCSADLSGSGQVAGLTDVGYQRWLVSFIRAQFTHFAGSVVVVWPGGRAVVRIQFSRPSPLGLLSAT
jgi:tetratricopeptide (TPR) repeat protein